MRSLTADVRERRLGVVVVAAAMFAVIFALRFAVEDPGAAVLLLCAAPTALLAVEFGIRGAWRPRC